MYYSGRVLVVLFEDPAKAFYVVKMVVDNEDISTLLGGSRQVTVRGHVPGLSVKPGTWFGFEAEWTTHSEYGRQLAITKAPVLQGGWDAETAEKMLAGNGAPERVVQQIRAHFGDAEFLAALADPARLQQVSGVNEFTAMFITQRWTTTRAYFQSLNFLGDLGLPAGKVRQVWSTFGDDAEKVLSQNPWALVQVDGITFQQADEIATRLRLDPESLDRVKGAALHIVKSQRNSGHLYLSTAQLFNEIRDLVPSVTPQQVGMAIAEGHKAGLLVVDRETREGVRAVYEPWLHKVEKESAELLKDRLVKAAFKGKHGLDTKSYLTRLMSVGPATEAEVKKKRPNLTKVARTAVEEWGQAVEITLSEDQKQGIIHALTEPVSILTGLPGTGKTTSLRAAVRIFQDSGIKFLLCAPTGIAAKNLSALTGAPASTIHRAFAAKGRSDEKRESTYTGIVGDADGGLGELGRNDVWGCGPHNPYPAEVIVVDEASMLDQHLLYRLLLCTSSSARIVLVGDAAQLPSVGPGNVLRDLISSGRFPVANLTQIFRQEDTSAIVYAAHAIFHGEVPECEPPSDFSLIQVRPDEEVLRVILRLSEKLYERRVNFQVLSPRHAGAVGVTNLNARMRELLNPPQSGLQEIRVGEDTIREGDRVMIVKNDYDLNVYNGDVGKVERVDRKAKVVEIKVFGEPSLLIRVPFKDMGALVRMAYACTVHKAQGLEYDVIVMPLVDAFRHQLQRNLLYTAVTRAKKRVILVGSTSALASAVSNDREDQRNTLFKDRMTSRGGLVWTPAGVEGGGATA